MLVSLVVPGGRSAAHQGPLADASDAPDAPDAPASKGHYLSDLRQGLRFLRHDSVLLSIILTVMVTNLLDAGFGAVLAPAYIRQVYGSPIVLGGIVAAFGGGAFLGTVAFGLIGHRLPRRLAMGGGFTLAGPTRWFALAFVPYVPALIAINAVAGFFIGPLNPLIGTIEFEHIPRELRTRVLGAVTAGAMVGQPLGGLLSGFVGVLLGLHTALLVFGACYLAATVSLLVNPALRAMGGAGIASPSRLAKKR